MSILSQLCANDIRFVNDIIYRFKFNYVLQLYVVHSLHSRQHAAGDLIIWKQKISVSGAVAFCSAKYWQTSLKILGDRD